MSVSLPFSDIFTGISDMSGHLIELYRIRRDGTFFEQQQFLSQARIDEAANAHKQLLERDALLAKGAEVDARAQQAHAIERDILTAGLEIAVSREIHRDTLEYANSPFLYDIEKTRSMITAASKDGSRPVILIAPFFQDHLSSSENDNGPHSFRVAIRRSWMSKAWHDDAELLDGILARPLRHTDTDLLIIQQSLHDLPIILVYGEMQDSQRAWTSVNAWNIAPHDKTPVIQVNLPAMHLDEIERLDSAPISRLPFEDMLGNRVALIVGTLAEWFHVVRSGRRPRLHTLAADNSGFGRRYLALATIGAYEIAVQHGSVSELEAKIQQASICADVGMTATAQDVASSALEDVRSGQTVLSRVDRATLKTLTSTLETCGPAELALASRQLLENRSRLDVLSFFGLGGEVVNPESSGRD